MILVADSGSTKTDWIVLSNDFKTLKQTHTIGFNPYFQDSLTIQDEILENTTLKEISKEITQVYFFGAGCSQDFLKKIVESGLMGAFPNAKADVDHDMTAAVYATYDGEPCISCILGTGSNSCYFDGEKLIQKTSGLGYILGDEGSGSYFGKRLLRAYLYEQLPEHILKRFLEVFPEINYPDIIKNVYRKPRANVYLASFSKFFSEFKDDPFVKPIIKEGIKSFLELHVKRYPESATVPVHFVGSVGFHFNEILHEAAGELDLKIGNVVQKPIESIVKFLAQKHS